MTGASPVLRPACSQSGARLAARRGGGTACGGAGADGATWGERPSGGAARAGGRLGDGCGQWKRPFEFPSMLPLLSSPLGYFSVAERSLPLLNLVEMLYQPRAQVLLYRRR